MTRPLHDHRREILRPAREHGARSARIFGSAARGDVTPNSDVDVLVEMGEGRSLVGHVVLKQDRDDLLGQDVGVVTEASLPPRLRERGLREAVSLE